MGPSSEYKWELANHLDRILEAPGPKYSLLLCVQPDLHKNSVFEKKVELSK